MFRRPSQKGAGSPTRGLTRLRLPPPAHPAPHSEGILGLIFGATAAVGATVGAFARRFSPTLLVRLDATPHARLEPYRVFTPTS